MTITCEDCDHQYDTTNSMLCPHDEHAEQLYDEHGTPWPTRILTTSEQP